MELLDEESLEEITTTAAVPGYMTPFAFSSKEDEKKKEFIIKDNIGYGEWEWDVLANEWELSALEEWGLDIPNLKLDAEFEEEPEIEITQEFLEEHNYIVFTFDNSFDWKVAK